MRRIKALITMGVAVGAMTAPVSAHAAALPLLQCTGDIVTTYSPGLTFAPQSVHVTVTEAYGSEADPVGTCVVLGAPITGGFHQHSRTLTLSCLSILESTPITETFTWNNGSTSTVGFTTSRYTDADGETVIVREGTVTAGFDSGALAEQTVTLLDTQLAACATPGGLSEISGLATLTFE